ncbi:MAG TPA: Dna2/Cas4 domain-containing protein, partial [Nitrosomonas sp.]|nr:Dna2/Cas4 domain-containing protein [Nitrosomonas sp.]
LRKQVEDTVTAVRALLVSGKLPPPVNDARCKECSLKEICQPEIMADKVRQQRAQKDLFEPDQ